MSEKTTDTQPWRPDEQARQQLSEQLRAASAGLRQSSAAIQQLIDELERCRADSPLGRYHARRQREAQAKQAETA
ncbi:hypothetical protein [Gloeobacter kilaueensis]|uniref:hypothetical protein n=1 Tax=Gloeobacter kilaueensis TaxID=1416614 RepID=UPI00042983DD|nr:hypothetical protein [Gloeobacter kilaueensis]